MASFADPKYIVSYTTYDTPTVSGNWLNKMQASHSFEEAMNFAKQEVLRRSGPDAATYGYSSIKHLKIFSAMDTAINFNEFIANIKSETLTKKKKDLEKQIEKINEELSKQYGGVGLCLST